MEKKKSRNGENWEAWFGGHKGHFPLVLGSIKKLACRLGIAVRPIEPLASLLCKSQLLLNGFIYLLDREIHLLDKSNIYWIEINTSTTISHNC